MGDIRISIVKANAASLLSDAVEQMKDARQSGVAQPQAVEIALEYVMDELRQMAETGHRIEGRCRGKKADALATDASDLFKRLMTGEVPEEEEATPEATPEAKQPTTKKALAKQGTTKTTAIPPKKRGRKVKDEDPAPDAPMPTPTRSGKKGKRAK